MRFLDIDLDAFLDDVAYYPEGDRLDPAGYVPWSEARLRRFLEQQCGLDAARPIRGWFVEDHDEAFDVLRGFRQSTGAQLEVVHVDGHADLGVGYASWLDLIGHVGEPLTTRFHPKRGSGELNLGSWLAYALAAEFISDLTYVFPPAFGDDLPAIHFLDMDPTSGFVEMKAFTRAGLPTMGTVIDYHALLRLSADLTLKPVPFATATTDAYVAAEPFDAGLLCRSPQYTPASSDALIPIVREYVDW